MAVVAEVNSQAVSVCSFSVASTQYMVVLGLRYSFANKAHALLVAFYNAFTHFVPTLFAAGSLIIAFAI